MEEIRTYLDIQDGIIDRAKLEDNDDVRRQLKEKINTFYLNLVYEKPYTWSGETKPLFMPKKYDTGTITVTQGSDQITGVGTSWSENDHLFLKMKISPSNIPFKIIRVGSSTTITLEQAWTGDTAAGVAYTIYQDDFGLFPDCQAVRKLTLAGFRRKGQPLPCSPTEMDDRRASAPFAGGTPTQYSAWGNSHYRGKTWATFNIDFDYWEDSFDDKPRNLNLTVWPAIRAQDIYSSVRYTIFAPPMSEDDDEPIIPISNRRVLLFGPLAEHFLQNRDIATQREWKNFYKEEKMKMESEIEVYDDETLLLYDNRTHAWSPNWSGYDERNEDR